MAATSHSTLPNSTYVGAGSKRDPLNAHTHQSGSYDNGYGSLTSHPYQYETNPYSGTEASSHNNKNYRSSDAYNHHQNGNHSDSQAPNHYNTSHHDPYQTEHGNGTHHYDRSDPVDNEHHRSDTQIFHSDHQQANHHHHHHSNDYDQPTHEYDAARPGQKMPKGRTSPPLHNHNSYFPNNNDDYYQYPPKASNQLQDLKVTKSSKMRAAAIQRKEKFLEQKRQDRYFPSSENKPSLIKSKSHYERPRTDVTKNTDEYSNHALHKTHAFQPKKHHKSRRDGAHHEGLKGSGDDDSHTRHRSKSQKRTTVSDTQHNRPSHLPPIRRGHPPAPLFDPYHDYPLRGTHPYHDPSFPYGPYFNPYSHHHLHGLRDDIPPYLSPYHDLYDPYFDYEKRKVKPRRAHSEHGHHGGYDTDRDDGTKSQLSRKSRNRSIHGDHTGRKSRRDYDEMFPPYWQTGYYPPHYYNRRDMLEVWRQERNDYLKKKFKPTVHDVLYSQMWLKPDSYLENQRRRALRDVQGFYFPYKKYTIKDYKDLQKLNMQNPYAEVNEEVIDRKERAKKRQEYGALVERQIADQPGTRYVTPRPIPQREPWRINHNEFQESGRWSKRERALDYAKDQIRYQPVDSLGDGTNRRDFNERYANAYFSNPPQQNNRSNNLLPSTKRFPPSYK